MNLCSSKLFLRHIFIWCVPGIPGIWWAIINLPEGGAVGLLEAVQKTSVSLPVSLSLVAFSLYSVLFVVVLSSLLWLHLEIGSHYAALAGPGQSGFSFFLWSAGVIGVHHHIRFDFCFFTPVALRGQSHILLSFGLL